MKRTGTSFLVISAASVLAVLPAGVVFAYAQAQVVAGGKLRATATIDYDYAEVSVTDHAKDGHSAVARVYMYRSVPARDCFDLGCREPASMEFAGYEYVWNSRGNGKTVTRGFGYDPFYFPGAVQACYGESGTGEILGCGSAVRDVSTW
jgi:hypothetical protein